METNKAILIIGVSTTIALVCALVSSPKVKHKHNTHNNSNTHSMIIPTTVNTVIIPHR